MSRLIDAIVRWMIFEVESILATLALIGIGVGCWWILPAAGLIVPSCIVLGLLVLSRW